MSIRRGGLYARVSTTDQHCEAQLIALRRYATAREWSTTEYVDHGVSGSEERRPALDLMLTAARRRELAVVVVTKLDRLARSLHHLVALGRELEALGVDLVVLDQAIDTATPSGRLLFHMLGAIAEFERDLIREHVISGLHHAKDHGTRTGRPIGRPRRAVDLDEILRRRAAREPWRKIARALRVPARTLRRYSREARQNPPGELSRALRHRRRVLMVRVRVIREIPRLMFRVVRVPVQGLEGGLKAWLCGKPPVVTLRPFRYPSPAHLCRSLEPPQ